MCCKMNLQDKIQKIISNYPYLDELLISDGDSKSTLHPAVKIGLAATMESFSGNDFKRIILLLPRREDYALWISYLTTLWTMKNDFDLDYKKAKLSSGNKIKLNNCVVEYIREELSADGKTWLMRVRCFDGEYAFRLDREYTLVPIKSEKKLSKLKHVCEAYNQSKITGFPLDDLLEIKANGNFNIFKNCVVTVSKLSKFEKFIDHYSINNLNLKKLIMVGKLRDDGTPVGISTDVADNTIPTSILSSDMFRLASYIENFTGVDKPLKGVVIDGAGYCEDNLQFFDDYFFPNDIPVTVVADYSDRRSLSGLQDRGFKILHINHKLLPPDSIGLTVKQGPFRFIEKNITNLSKQTIEVIKSNDQNIEDLFQKIFLLEKMEDFQNVDQIISECWMTLLSVALDISRKWYVPSDSYIAVISDKLEKAASQLDSRNMWMSEELKRDFHNVFNSISEILNDFEACISNKLLNIKEILSHVENSKTILLSVDEAEARTSADYWHNKLSRNSIRPNTGYVNSEIEFVAFSKVGGKNLKSIKTDITAMCGWPGKEKYLSVLNLFLSPRLCLFLSAQEHRWFESAHAEWKRIAEVPSDVTILQKIFDMKNDQIEMLSAEDLTSKKRSPEQEQETEDIFFRLKRYQLARYISTPLETDVMKTRYIQFSDSRFAFMTESHMHHVVSELIHKKNSSVIPKVKTEELKVGDYILFMDSDRNIIHDIADKWLETEHKSKMRETASLWKQSLIKKYDRLGRDMAKLSELLSASGCRRTDTTLRKWLFDDEIIGPQDYDRDLACIAEATGDIVLKDKLLDVKVAIGNLRSLHMQAATLVRERCIATLSSSIDTNNMNQQDVMIIDVEGIKAKILRIEEIGSEWVRVKHSEINKLHILENV